MSRRDFCASLGGRKERKINEFTSYSCCFLQDGDYEEDEYCWLLGIVLEGIQWKNKTNVFLKRRETTLTQKVLLELVWLQRRRPAQDDVLRYFFETFRTDRSIDLNYVFQVAFVVGVVFRTHFQMVL